MDPRKTVAAAVSAPPAYFILDWFWNQILDPIVNPLLPAGDLYMTEPVLLAWAAIISSASYVATKKGTPK